MGVGKANARQTTSDLHKGVSCKVLCLGAACTPPFEVLAVDEALAEVVPQGPGGRHQAGPDLQHHVAPRTLQRPVGGKGRGRDDGDVRGMKGRR